MKIDEKAARDAIGDADVRRFSSWTIPLVVLLVAAAIGIGIFVFLAGPTVEEVQGNIQGNTYSPTADTSRAHNHRRFGLLDPGKLHDAPPLPEKRRP